MPTQPQTGAPKTAQEWDDPTPTALLVLADGTVLEGIGFGATGHAVGEVCFNTAMTGYEEILTDPSYAGQIITFTFPHIGNVGTNEEDIETVNLAATPGARRGAAFRHHATVELSRHKTSRCLAEEPRRYRACRHRHPRAHRAHSRKGHAERGHRARAVRAFRCRSAQARGESVAGSPRHGFGADGDHRPALSPGTRRPGFGAKVTASAATRNITSSPSTTASSATFCASSPATPAT